MLHTDEDYMGLLDESVFIEIGLWLVFDYADVALMTKAMGKAPAFS